MLKSRLSFRFALLLCAVLLTVQFGALNHGVQHPFHIADSVCDAYIAAEHQGHALVSLDVLPVVPVFYETPQRVCPVFSPTSMRRAFQARAPPLLSA